MGRRKDNHKNSTNQGKLKINGYKGKYNDEHIKLVNKISNPIIIEYNL